MSMKPILAVVTIAALGLLVWWMQSTAKPAAPRADRADAGGLAVAAPTTLPPMDAGVRPPVDAMLPDAAIDTAWLHERGTIGAPAKLVDEFVAREVLGEYWKRDGNRPLTWRNAQGVVVSLVEEGGRVTGGRVTFGKKSSSPELQATSLFFTGARCALQPPGYEQADTTKGTARSGQFECNGKTLHYKGEVSFDGGPGRPVWFEYSTTPLD